MLFIDIFMTKILQLKIRLNGIRPPIWRRFLVEDSITFEELHEIIQNVMGWENYHMYEFKLYGLRISEPDEELGFEVVNSKEVKLSEFLKAEKQMFYYIYDFGDRWEHTITVEKILEKDNSKKYPVCIAGKRACPPEDCGGVYGYEEFLEAIKDPKHEEHESMLEWIGGEFDPEEFNLEEVNKLLLWMVRI